MRLPKAVATMWRDVAHQDTGAKVCRVIWRSGPVAIGLWVLLFL